MSGAGGQGKFMFPQATVGNLGHSTQKGDTSVMGETSPRPEAALVPTNGA